MTGASLIVPNIWDLYRGDMLQAVTLLLQAITISGVAEFRCGTISLGILDLAKDVIFSSPLPSTNYFVFLQPHSGVTIAFWPGSFAIDKFTINVSLGALATYAYLAIGVP